MDELLTVGQAARVLNLSPEHVRHLERTGKLSARRVGRGLRLFEGKEIERLRLERRKRTQSKSAPQQAA